MDPNAPVTEVCEINFLESGEEQQEIDEECQSALPTEVS